MTIVCVREIQWYYNPRWLCVQFFAIIYSPQGVATSFILGW